MTSTNVLEIIRGDDESIEVTILDEDDENLIQVNDKLFITVKKSIDTDATDSSAVFKKTYTVAAEDATLPYVIDLSNTETVLPLGVYHMDIQWINNSIVKTIFRGSLNVTYDVSRRIT